MTKLRLIPLLLLLGACSSEPSDPDASDGGDAAGDAATGSADMSSSPDMQTADDGAEPNDMSAQPDATDPTDMAAPDMAAPDMAPDTGLEDMGPPPACDYQTVNDVLVIEAEDLPLGEDWTVGTTEAGYTGNGYIDWVGPSFNNDPSHGVMSVDVRIATPGRYQLQWHVRIGEGTNTTEHNDAFVRFADADDFYGLKGAAGAEIRRYPKPPCDDAALMAMKEALPDVDVADCVRSTSVDSWVKVYCSGASDWRWSTKTSDNDASDIMIEFDAPGVYTFELAARADRFLIDRMVLHLETVDDDVARDLSLPATPCD